MAEGKVIGLDGEKGGSAFEALKKHCVPHGKEVPSLSRVPEETAQRTMPWLQNRRHMLILVGTFGSGKTYTAQALAFHLVEKKRDVCYLTEQEFEGFVRREVMNGNDSSLTIRWRCDSEFLILDDLGKQRVTDARRDWINELIDIRWNEEKPTVITSNLNRQNMEDLYGGALASRIWDRRNTIIESWNAQDLRELEEKDRGG